MLRLEVLDFFDPSGTTIVARVPEHGTAAIQSGAQLLVQQNQEAVFFRDGRPMDRFQSGRYTLSTKNIPILTKILTIPWEKSPFQACVYFVGLQRFINQGWGTRNPITMRDPDFGIVRLRGFGKYAFRITDSGLFLSEIVGTQGKVTSQEISDYLRDVVVSGLADLLATANLGLLRLAGQFDELAAAARVKIGEQFKRFGLELTDFVINNISPPPEVQKAIDARSSMAAIGDLRSYTLYQTAKGLGEAGGAGSLSAQVAAGLGAGLALPPLLNQALNGPRVVTQAPRDSQPPVEAKVVPAQQVDFSKLANSVPDDESVVRNVRQQVEELANRNRWQVIEDDGCVKLIVTVGQLRRQHVYISFDRVDESGHSVVSIWSPCGPFDASKAATLLRFNDQLIHGGFAVRDEASSQQLVLRANLLADTLDALELTRTVSAIAWQADRLEEQIYGTDSQ